MYAILLLIAVLMAGHRGGGYPSKGRYSLRRIRLTPELALAALATDTVLVANLILGSEQEYRFISMKGTWSIHNHTPGEGPIAFGVAHGDYTVTEIKECLESFLSISPGDKIAEERSNRMVRQIATFSGVAASETVNNGNPIKTRLNWAIQDSTAVLMWFYNEDTNDLTTGTVATFSGNMWVKDT